MAVTLQADSQITLTGAADRLVRDLQEQSSTIAIGINGLDCSGKTTFAEALKASFARSGKDITLLHVDAFNNQKTQKTVYGAYTADVFDTVLLDRYYTNSIDYSALYQAVKKLKSMKKPFIIEGVFLFKPPMLEHFR